MTYPPPSGGWQDPPWSGQQSSPPAAPTLPVSGQPIPTQPTGGDPYAPGNPYAAAGYPPAAYPGYGYAPQKTNGLAIAALVLALAGVATCISAPVGAILGHVASKQIQQTGEAGEGMAKAAIIVGWILTALFALLIVVYPLVAIFAVTQAASGSSV